ncbi:hypothetical protein SBDP1_310002 [Syntrophobacter sp. SbD1]|nr:hypothetical protein SBDP1_310002 [Syntrophobacter sp. SbD1]
MQSVEASLKTVAFDRLSASDSSVRPIVGLSRVKAFSISSVLSTDLLYFSSPTSLNPYPPAIKPKIETGSIPPKVEALTRLVIKKHINGSLDKPAFYYVNL